MLTTLFLGVVLFFLLLVAAGIIYRSRSGWCKCASRMEGKTVIVTGASAGIGKETARDLASRGAKVIMACRNLEKAEQVAREIIRTTGNTNVVVMQVDTSSLQSVRKFAKAVLEAESALHVLINNAGAGIPDFQLAEDGLELTMATNHFGHFLLTNMLLGLLKKTAPSRIINVSSRSHFHCKKLEVDDLNYKKRSYTSYFAYAQSKLCNVMFTIELAKRLEGTDVTVNALGPGFVATEIFGKFNSFFAKIIAVMSTFLAKDEVGGAQSTIHLSVSEDVATVTGKYFNNCKESTYSNIANDSGLRKKLWEVSEEAVKLSSSERHF